MAADGLLAQFREGQFWVDQYAYQLSHYIFCLWEAVEFFGDTGSDVLVCCEVVGESGCGVATYPSEELILDAFEAVLGVEGHVEGAIGLGEVLSQEMGDSEDL